MRVLAIASAGGHWVQLLRLIPAIDKGDLIFVSTNQSFASTVEDYPFYSVPDSNRWNKWKLVESAIEVARLVFRLQPKVVITTGAAPGLMGIIAGRLIGARTIWIDSIANVEKVSLSGRIAVRFASRVYTQWPHLSTHKIVYSNSVLA